MSSAQTNSNTSNPTHNKSSAGNNANKSNNGVGTGNTISHHESAHQHLSNNVNEHKSITNANGTHHTNKPRQNNRGERKVNNKPIGSTVKLDLSNENIRKLNSEQRDEYKVVKELKPE